MVIATSQHSPVSLPKATFHQVEHLFDSPLTFQEYAEHIEQNHEQLLWLHSLFIAIQVADKEDLRPQIKPLALMGAHFSESWIKNIDMRRTEFDSSYCRSKKKT